VSESLRFDQATLQVKEWLGPRRPTVAMVLGSGLGSLTEGLADPVRLSFAEIPGFPAAAVEGHSGDLVAGHLGGKEVLVQSGRFHQYEGHSAATVALPVRTFASLGVKALLLTNAAGGIRRTFRPGALMLIADQLNLTFVNPLVGGLMRDELRFPDMSDPYDLELRGLARAVAQHSRIFLEEGVYAGVSGPSYETPAEIRMLERWGADAVGMSTVHEVVAARARGLRCLGISTITNLAAGLTPVRLSHHEVIRASRRAAQALGELVAGIVAGV
jgi:purine-nucleoside phosphorylase